MCRIELNRIDFKFLNYYCHTGVKEGPENHFAEILN